MRLEGDVAREPVADDDVGRAARDVAALDVAAEVEVVGRRRAARAPPASARCPCRPPRRSRAGRSWASGRSGSPWRRPSPCRRTAAGARRADRRSRRSRPARRRRARTAAAARSRAAARPRCGACAISEAAIIAPVEPAETAATAPPSRTARQHWTSEESGFARTANAGSSSQPITCGASTMSMPRRQLAAELREQRPARGRTGARGRHRSRPPRPHRRRSRAARDLLPSRRARR